MRRCLIAWNAIVKLNRSSYFVRWPEISCNYLRSNVPRALFSALPSDVLSKKTEDVLTNNLMNDLTLENTSSLTTDHLLTALNSLVEPAKNDPNYKSEENARLQLLCTQLLKKIRFFELKDVVAILSSLVYLKVPADTIVMQSFLQVVRSHVNELSFGQIFWLDTIFKKTTPTPLVDALKLALPIVLLNHLDMQMDRSDATMLAKLFSFGTHHGFSKEALIKISLPLMRLSPQWTCNNAMTVLWGAVFLKSPFPHFEDLVLTATDIVVKHMSEISPHELLHLMPRLKKTNLLSKPLLKAVSNKAILEKWEMKAVHDLLWLMSQVSYFDIELLETYAVALENQFLSHNATLSLSLQEVVAIFAKPNFVPHNMEFLLKKIIKPTNQINSIQADPDTLVRCALDFILLGASPSDVAYLLNGSHKCLYEYSKRSDHSFIKSILLLKALMGTSFSNEKLYMLVGEVHEELLIIASERVKAKGFPLRLALEKCLTHMPYRMYSGIITKSGFYFDHLLVNGVDAGSTYTEKVFSSKKLHIADDLLTSDSSIKIAILVNSEENYAINTNHHNGETQLTILALEKNGFVTVQICLQQWNELLHQEQIPYLLRAIKTSLNNRFNRLTNW